MSNIVVQKFGGTSLADTDRFKAVAKIIKDTSKKGKKVVAVVSAMAGETQRLIDLAKEVQEIPDPREYDALISSGEQVSVALLAMTLRNEEVNSKYVRRLFYFGSCQKLNIIPVENTNMANTKQKTLTHF